MRRARRRKERKKGQIGVDDALLGRHLVSLIELVDR